MYLTNFNQFIFGIMSNCRPCKKSRDGSCLVYGLPGQLIRNRFGYCPVPDMYFDPDAQKAYEKRKGLVAKKRIGQQKQRRR